MRKTLTAANRGERVPFKIPRSVQQSIPIQRAWQDGIWQVNGRFSQTWRFADINYSLASYEDQRDMFTSYCGVLNSLPTDAVTKITIHNLSSLSSINMMSCFSRDSNFAKCVPTAPAPAIIIFIAPLLCFLISLFHPYHTSDTTPVLFHVL